jgi:hypothetical protein
MHPRSSASRDLIKVSPHPILELDIGQSVWIATPEWADVVRMVCAPPVHVVVHPMAVRPSKGKMHHNPRRTSPSAGVRTFRT